MIDAVKAQLSNRIDGPLFDALLEAYQELKSHYYLGKHKPSELEGAHFCEVVVRILDFVTTSTYAPLGAPLAKLDGAWLQKYSNLPQGRHSDSIRIHIPRAVFAIYGIRNRRGVGHIGGDVKPNLADATFVVATCDWILAELVRLDYTSSLAEAQKLVDSLVVRKVPLLQDFDGFLKVLNPQLSVPDQTLAILYQKNGEGSTRQELRQWVQTTPANLSKALSRLIHQRRYVHDDGGRYLITHAGEQYVECHIPLHF